MEFRQIIDEIDKVLKKLDVAREKDVARKNGNRNEEKKIIENEWKKLSGEAIESVSKEIKNIIVLGACKEMVEGAEILGKCLTENGLTTSQIRNIFGEVKEMEMKGFRGVETEKKLWLLKPNLAYAAARPGAKPGTKELRDILTTAIDAVIEDEKKEEKFDNFCKFFEAILAYHRAAGGK